MFPVSFDGEPSLGVFKVKWYDKILSVIAMVIMAGVAIMHAYYPIRSFNDTNVVVNGSQIR